MIRVEVLGQSQDTMKNPDWSVALGHFSVSPHRGEEKLTENTAENGEALAAVTSLLLPRCNAPSSAILYGTLRQF